MNEKQTNWCACEGHNATDWTLVSDFYAKHFILRAWKFEYRTMDCHDDGRVL